MGDLTNNFDSREFACPCCGQSKMDQDFMLKLQQIRDDLGERIGIIKDGGGFRCDIYDQSNSAHKEGKAADLDVGYEHYYAIIKTAMKVGITGIGVKNKGVGNEKRFQLHLDSADNIEGVRPRPWIWTY